MKPMVTAVVTLVIGLLVGSVIGIAIGPSVMPSQVTPTGANTTVTTTASGAMASALAKLKVGLIEPITPEDYSWNYQANYSLSLLAQQFGFNYTVAENLFDGTSAEPVATQWATSGYNVIIGQGIQYQDMFIKIAPQFPNTLFLCVDCFNGGHDGTDPGNVGDVWWYMADGAYLVGMLAGNLTKTNILGLVGGGRVPSIWAGHEAFKRGALAVNPKVTFIETWMPFSWADVAGAKKAAEEAADQGADFVFSSGDGVDVGVRQAAAEKNIYCSGVYADSSHLDPAHIVTSIVVHWDIAYLSALADYARGDYQNIWLQADLFSGMVSLGQFGSMVPASMQAWILHQEINMQTTNGVPYHLDFSCFDNGTQPQCKI
jgi:basic membrane protein A